MASFQSARLPQDRCAASAAAWSAYRGSTRQGVSWPVTNVLPSACQPSWRATGWRGITCRLAASAAASQRSACFASASMTGRPASPASATSLRPLLVTARRISRDTHRGPSRQASSTSWSPSGSTYTPTGNSHAHATRTNPAPSSLTRWIPSAVTRYGSGITYASGSGQSSSPVTMLSPRSCGTALMPCAAISSAAKSSGPAWSGSACSARRRKSSATALRSRAAGAASPGNPARQAARRSAINRRRSGPSNRNRSSPRIRYGHLVARRGWYRSRASASSRSAFGIGRGPGAGCRSVTGGRPAGAVLPLEARRLRCAAPRRDSARSAGQRLPAPLSHLARRASRHRRAGPWRTRSC